MVKNTHAAVPLNMICGVSLEERYGGLIRKKCPRVYIKTQMPISAGGWFEEPEFRYCTTYRKLYQHLFFGTETQQYFCTLSPYECL